MTSKKAKLTIALVKCLRQWQATLLALACPRWRKQVKSTVFTTKLFKCTWDSNELHLPTAKATIGYALALATLGDVTHIEPILMEQYTFKNVNHCLNTNIYSYLETSGGQSSNPHLNAVHFFNTRVK